MVLVYFSFYQWFFFGTFFWPTAIWIVTWASNFKSALGWLPSHHPMLPTPRKLRVCITCACDPFRCRSLGPSCACAWCSDACRAAELAKHQKECEMLRSSAFKVISCFCFDLFSGDFGSCSALLKQALLKGPMKLGDFYICCFLQGQLLNISKNKFLDGQGGTTFSLQFLSPRNFGRSEVAVQGGARKRLPVDLLRCGRSDGTFGWRGGLRGEKWV